MKGVFSKRSYGKTVIGIVGMSAGMGVTHLTITLANYIVERWGLKVAVLECNDHKSLEKLPHDKAAEQKGHFRLLGVDYYTRISRGDVSAILNEGYDYYLIDFGCEYEICEEELLRCDRKILIGSCSEWRKNEILALLRRFSKYLLKSDWDMLSISGVKDDKKEIEKKAHCNLQYIPYLENPFQTERKNFGFLEHFV